jgi:nucleoside 2-deoxyribosyltransferase
MKVYVAHSTSFDYKTQLYQPLREANIAGVEFIFPHEHSEEPTNSKQRMKEFDVVLAEVSYPSTGAGIELGWADMLGIPIVCVHKEGTDVSGAVKGVCGEAIEYDSSEGLREVARKSVEQYS